MPILSFKKRFIEAVKSGAKKNTIRADKGGRWRIGSTAFIWCENPRTVSLNPYSVGEAIITKVSPISIKPAQNEVLIAGKLVKDLDGFARADGFENWADMVKFFPIDFVGKIIYWDEVKQAKAVQAEKENSFLFTGDAGDKSAKK